MAFPVALQVYSVRDAAAADMMGTLEKIAALGYDGVEFAGFYGYAAKDVKAKLDELGLKAVSSHVPLATLKSDLDSTIAYHKTLDCKYIAVPYLEEQDRPGTARWSETVELIREIGQHCKQNGIRLLYHNHDFEFIKVNDQYALDMLYSSIPADTLGAELDTCWVKFVGEDPCAYIRKYSGRAPVVHLKDYYMEGTFKAGETPYALINASGTDDHAVNDRATFDFRPVGYGVQNFPDILAASKDAGAEWIVVEQDRSTERSPMEAAKLSREYLKSIGN